MVVAHLCCQTAREDSHLNFSTPLKPDQIIEDSELALNSYAYIPQTIVNVIWLTAL